MYNILTYIYHKRINHSCRQIYQTHVAFAVTKSTKHPLFLSAPGLQLEIFFTISEWKTRYFIHPDEPGKTFFSFSKGIMYRKRSLTRWSPIADTGPVGRVFLRVRKIQAICRDGIRYLLFNYWKNVRFLSWSTPPAFNEQRASSKFWKATTKTAKQKPLSSDQLAMVIFGFR